MKVKHLTSVNPTQMKFRMNWEDRPQSASRGANDEVNTYFKQCVLEISLALMQWRVK